MNKSKPIYQQEGLTSPEFISLLYKQFGKKLYAYAIHQWKIGEDEAWDIVYKTLYKVIETYKKYQFENEEKFAGFIFKIFINYLRNHYHDTKKKNENLAVTDITPNELNNKPISIIIESPADPKLIALNEELEKMEDWQRMLLLMRSEGMAYNEIAKYINKPEEQLKVYYQRLKESITKKLYERL